MGQPDIVGRRGRSCEFDHHGASTELEVKACSVLEVVGGGFEVELVYRKLVDDEDDKEGVTVMVVVEVCVRCIVVVFSEDVSLVLWLDVPLRPAVVVGHAVTTLVRVIVDLTVIVMSSSSELTLLGVVPETAAEVIATMLKRKKEFSGIFALMLNQ